jgi:uncharacterized membrane protein
MPTQKKARTRRGGTRGPSSRHDQLGLERLVFFSDAVFAIAVTLLVLEIRLPGDVGQMSNEQLRGALFANWHKYLAYGISFLVIGTFWLSHHRKFRLIERYDRRLLLGNLLFLLVIAFVPFPSSVISESGNRTATIFYALTMALAGTLMTLLWWHAAHDNHLLAAGVSAQDRRRQAAAPLATTAIFLLSIGVAFIGADLAKFSWLLILPATIIAGRA